MATPITWNATDIADGVRDIRGKWINNAYLRNANPDWTPISAAFKEDGDGWQTENCQMRIVVPKIATRPIRFINSVAWDVHNNTSIGASEQELLISHPDASPVDGVLGAGRENQIVYPNAIMDGVDIVAGIWHGRGPRAEHIYCIRKMPPGIGDLMTTHIMKVQVLNGMVHK